MRNPKWTIRWSLLLTAALLLPNSAIAAMAASAAVNATAESLIAAPQGSPALNSFTSELDNLESFDAVQVMAKGLDADTGAFYDMYKYVAGKDTCLRALFTGAVVVPKDGSMYVEAFRDGESLGRMYPVTDADIAREVYFYADAGEAPGLVRWEAGNYRFVLHADGKTARRETVLRETKPIRVLAVPIRSYTGGNIAECAGAWREAGQYARECYPVSKEGFQFVLAPELDLAHEYFDLNTEKGMYNVWKKLTMMQNPEEEYDLICGFLPEKPAGGKMSGYTYGSPATIVAEDAGNMPAIVTHEIAHCYGVGDEYPRGSLNLKVNPAPYHTAGVDKFTQEPVVSLYEHLRPANEFGLQNVSCYIYPEQAPWNVTQRAAVSPADSFMGFGDTPQEEGWITSDIWNHLYDCLATGAAASGELNLAAAVTMPERWYKCPGCYSDFNLFALPLYGYCADCGTSALLTREQQKAEKFRCEGCGQEIQAREENVSFQCPACKQPFFWAALTEAVRRAESAAEEADASAIRIEGTILPDGRFDPLPWHSAPASEITPFAEGTYAVALLDQNGGELARHTFEPVYDPDVDTGKVSLVARLPEGAAEIAILRDRETLYRQKVSASAPEAAFVGIKPGMKLSGEQTVRWTASDADQDTLSFSLWYQPKGGEAVCIAPDVRGTSAVVDFGALPGSGEARLRLSVTDGANASAVLSPPFSVPYSAPEITLADTFTFSRTEDILLEASVYDRQDGWLYFDELTWHSGGKEISKGHLYIQEAGTLAAGPHRFTLEAVNSHGQKSSKAFTINIV